MSGNAISTTGLIASPKKKVDRRKLSAECNLSKCAIARPVQFSLRPFGGLFNPYSKGCSILCNHPGPNEVKNVVKQVKEQCIADVKGHYQKEDDGGRGRNHHTDFNTTDIADPNLIPEEFFRRYTGSDSRPLTPTPTVASGRTKTSASSHYYQPRRCFTPDPIKNSDHERKQIVLDLRRSHSQETLFWNASSELSPVLLGYDVASKGGAAAKGERPPSGSGGQRTKNMRLCEQEARKKSAERKAQQQKEAEMKAATNTIVCINELESVDDDSNDPKRRRKKKKKSKGANGNVYHVSQEPETQIAALGPDSPNASARPSLVPTGNNAPQAMAGGEKKRSSADPLAGNQSSFLTDETLKILKRGLDIAVVESAFTKYMNKALTEALRFILPEQVEHEKSALRQCKESILFPNVDNERWLPMPRKYTRNSTRFTLPIKTGYLTILTPFQYVSQHVWISNHRKQLYQYVFSKFVAETNAPVNDKLNERLNVQDTPPSDIDKCGFDFYQNRERVMEYKHLDQALKFALGFHGTTEKIAKVKEILLLNQDEIVELNFRSWGGVVAFTERYLNELPVEEDPIDEVEVADFESLERKFSYVVVPEPLKYILNFLKYNKK